MIKVKSFINAKDDEINQFLATEKGDLLDIKESIAMISKEDKVHTVTKTLLIYSINFAGGMKYGK